MQKRLACWRVVFVFARLPFYGIIKMLKLIYQQLKLALNNKMAKNKKIINLLALLLLVFPVVAHGWAMTSVTSYGLPQGSIWMIVTNIMRWVLGIFGVIGVIGFVISGFLYLTSAGQEAQIESAKKAMTYSIIGVIVGISGVVILQAVDAALRGGIF